MRERLLVVGNGMAGIRAVEEVLAHAPDRYDIVMFGAEPHPAYSRIMLSPLLSGEKTVGEITTHDIGWYTEHGVTLHAGVSVSAIHAEARLVVTDDARSFAYDKLILATGSRASILPVPGNGLPGVVGFRNLSDVQYMLAAVSAGSECVVIGGGLLGLEAAYGLTQRGARATVVHLMPDLMERQLDREASSLLRRQIERLGVNVICPAETERITGADRATGVRLKDGRELAADLVVMAIGITPEVELARRAGLEVARGIVVDDAMQTSDANIFAVGECAEHDGICHGLVAPLYEMAKILAVTLAGGEGAYVAAPPSARLKVSGVDLFSAGDLATGPGREDVVMRDPGRGVYRRLVIERDRLIGAILYGDTTDSGFYLDLIGSGADIASIRDALIFGRVLCEAA